MTDVLRLANGDWIVERRGDEVRVVVEGDAAVELCLEIGIDHGRYRYDVAWSDDDQEYVGTCSWFPSLSWLATTQDEALAGITELVAEASLERHLMQGGQVDSTSIKEKIALLDTPMPSGWPAPSPLHDLVEWIVLAETRCSEEGEEIIVHSGVVAPDVAIGLGAALIRAAVEARRTIAAMEAKKAERRARRSKK